MDDFINLKKDNHYASPAKGTSKEPALTPSQFEKIYQRILEITHCRTQVELSHCLNIQQASLSGSKIRYAIPPVWYLRLLEKYGINPYWLKTGCGPQYLNIYSEEAPAKEEKVRSPLEQPVLAPVYSMRAYDKGKEEPRPTHAITLPAAFLEKDLIVMEVEDATMEPGIRKGAYVGIRQREKHFASGDVFALTMPLEGTILRRVYLESDHGSVVLKAEGDQCPPLSLTLTGFTRRAVGRMAWMMQRF